MQLPTLQEPKPEKTEVGSYFVANYPPFSTWSPEHVPAALTALNTPPQSDAKLGLYLHIPFCRKRCKFCYFRVYTDKNASDVETYLNAITREIALYSKLPGIGNRQFEFVYFGGGTPSFLSNEQLHRLIDRINQHWTWEAAKEVTFECEPGTLRESKLQTIRSIGVTRLSLGVEHFDDEILALNGRAHKSPEIHRAFQQARQIGFPQINIDLIAGMLGETDDKWKYAVDQAIALDPDSITIYQLELPHNTVISKEARQNQAEPAIAPWAVKRAWVDYAFNHLQSAGYEVSSAYTLVKAKRHAGFVYRDAVWHGADMIGAGVASFSHFAGVHYQNLDTWETYTERLAQDQLPIHRALPTTPRQRLIRELVLQLKLGRLDPAYFQQRFATDILTEFAAPFASLVEEGYATITEPTQPPAAPAAPSFSIQNSAFSIRLTRPGLLRIDSLLPRFFEPQHRNIRYT